MKNIENPENPENGSLFPPDKRPLMTKSEYAAHRGVSPSAITRAKAEDRLHLVNINGRELVDVKASDALWSGLTRPRIDAPGPDAPPAAGIDIAELAGLADELKAARLRRERAAAEMAELDLDQRCGLLVERDVIEFLVADLGTTVRNKLQELPGKLTPAIQSCQGDAHAIHARVNEQIHQLLRDIAEHIERQIERHLPDILDSPDAT